MFASRSTARALRSSATQPVTKRVASRRTFATAQDASSSSANGGGGMSQGVLGGVVGGSAVFAATYLYYRTSGIATVVDTTKQAKQYTDMVADQVKTQLKELTPDKNDVVGQIRSVADKYAAWIPGGKEFVNSSFKDIDDIRQKHGKEFDDIAQATYDELREVANKKGASLDTLNDVWQILTKRLSQISELAGDSAQQILENHPEAKKKFGGSFDQLKQLGDQLGPEAKKQVQDTFQQASQIASAGFSADAATKIYKLVQDKKQELQKMGEESWKAGYEQLKPMLEKNPQVKQFVEDNMDTLKNGNMTDVVDKVRNAAQSGNLGGLQKYVDEGKKKAEQYTSGGLSTWFKSMPNGSEILPQLQKLKEAAESKGPEAEKLGKDTVDEISKVLERRSKEAEELLKK
jgi:hypothetical protein